MEKTPHGTNVGVDDPYDVAGVCDHLTDDGRCRYALDRADVDSSFVAARRRAGYSCVAAEPSVRFRECSKYRSTTTGRACIRCGLQEVRIAGQRAARPLLEEHHLSYRDANADTGHEITVSLCRWCHAKIHTSFARIDDDARPAIAAIAAREQRRTLERAELSFTPASEREDL
jgi:hypothetical protein